MKYLKRFNENKYQDEALDNLIKVKDFNNLRSIDKLALLSGSNDPKLKLISLTNIYRENGGTFGYLTIKVRIFRDKDEKNKDIIDKEGWLFPYINYNTNQEPYVKVRFDEFSEDEKLKGGGSYEEANIYLKNIYPIEIDNIKSNFIEHKNKVEQDRKDFLSGFRDLFDDEDFGDNL